MTRSSSSRQTAREVLAWASVAVCMFIQSIVGVGLVWEVGNRLAWGEPMFAGCPWVGQGVVEDHLVASLSDVTARPASDVQVADECADWDQLWVYVQSVDLNDLARWENRLVEAGWQPTMETYPEGGVEPAPGWLSPNGTLAVHIDRDEASNADEQSVVTIVLFGTRVGRG